MDRAKRRIVAHLLLVASTIKVAHGFVATPLALSTFPAPALLTGYGFSHLSISAQLKSTAEDSNDDGGLENSDKIRNFRLGSNLHMDRRSAASALLAAGAGSTASSILWTNPGLASAIQSNAVNTVPTWKLEGGVQMPTLALNTVGLSVEDTTRAVRYAVQEGLGHIDFHPGKERDGVAAYLRENGRGGLFLNTKIRKAPPGTSPQEAADRTRKQIDEDLQALGLESVDMLMLRDSPDCDVIQAQWAVLEKALASGKTRSLGVINFCEKALTCVLETAKVKPALNYYM